MPDPVTHAGRDRAWPAADALTALPLERPGLTVAAWHPRSLQLASGLVAAALKAAGVAGPALGWPGQTTAKAHALRLARDRVLLVDGTPLAPGWHKAGKAGAAAGFAVSDLADGLVALDLFGPALPDLLAQATDRRPSVPSPSLRTGFAGLPATLHQLPARDALRLYIERPHLPTLCAWLRAAD